MVSGEVIDKASCSAKTRTGAPCRRPAGFGTDHVGIGRCKNHGGCTPNHQLAGVITLARREAAVMGRPLEIDPLDAILECIRIAAGEVQYASDRVAELEEPAALVLTRTVRERPLSLGKDGESPETQVKETTVGTDATLHAWIRVRQEAMDRLVTYSKTAIACGIAERRVQLAEAQGQMLAGAIRNILVALGVADHPEAQTVVRRELTAIAGATAIAA